MGQKYNLLWVWGIILLFPVLLAGPLRAAEGTAHLTFQKKVVAKTGRLNQRQPYIVKRGDTLTRIVRKLGGKAPNYEEIKQLNPHIPNLNKIYPGQQLVLMRPGTQPDIDDNLVKIRDYRAQKGDSLTRIIVSALHARPPEVAKILRSIKHLNPAVTDLNKIFPGQILKIPLGKSGAADGEMPLQSAVTAVAGESPSLKTSQEKESRLRLLGGIIKELNGTLLTSGNYYIPLPATGQLTLDCGTIPVAELDDGTTILLDFTGRLPDELAKIIRTRWRNYHLVKFSADVDVVSLLQEILLPSTYGIKKMEDPLLLGHEPQIKLYPEWLITRKAPSGSVLPQVGLFFAADKSSLLPYRVLSYAKKRGVNICEILGDKLQSNVAEQAVVSPLVELKAGSDEELIYNFLIFLGLDPLPAQEIKIFDTRKDGFNLAIKAEYVVKRGNKTILILKNKLPQQFNDILKKEGMEPFYQGPASKKNLLEGLLTALAIPHQFALYSLPAAEEKAGFRVYFPALKIEREKGTTYLIDFDMDREIYELLADYGRLNIVRY